MDIRYSNKSSGRRPSFTGTGSINGKEYEAAGWVRVGKTSGNKYVSLKITEAGDGQHKLVGNLFKDKENDARYFGQLGEDYGDENVTHEIEGEKLRDDVGEYIHLTFTDLSDDFLSDSDSPECGGIPADDIPF